MDAEEWRFVPGTGERWAVSSHGRVRNHSLNGAHNIHRRSAKGRVVVPFRYRGYPYVSASFEGKRRSPKALHVLVALTFLGDRPQGMHIRHLDGDKANSIPSNLAYGTAKENSDDQAQHGTAAVGSRNGNSKLSEKDVVEIRHARAVGKAPTKELAERYGVSRGYINQILQGKTWKWVV